MDSVRDSLRRQARLLWRPTASVLLLAACMCPDFMQRPKATIDATPPAPSAPVAPVAAAPAPTNWAPVAALPPMPTRPFEISYTISAPKKGAPKFWRTLEKEVRALVGASLVEPPIPDFAPLSGSTKPVKTPRAGKGSAPGKLVKSVVIHRKRGSLTVRATYEHQKLVADYLRERRR